MSDYIETISYTPKAPAVKSAPYNKILVNWSHGFQHSLVCTGNTLMAQLKDLESMFYVREVLHWEITREEYESFYNMPLEDDEGPEEKPVEKKSRGKKAGLKFSSLENFFDGEKPVVKKSRRK